MPLKRQVRKKKMSQSKSYQEHIKEDVIHQAEECFAAGRQSMAEDVLKQMRKYKGER